MRFTQTYLHISGHLQYARIQWRNIECVKIEDRHLIIITKYGTRYTIDMDVDDAYQRISNFLSQEP